MSDTKTGLVGNSRVPTPSTDPRPFTSTDSQERRFEEAFKGITQQRLTTNRFDQKLKDTTNQILSNASSTSAALKDVSQQIAANKPVFKQVDGATIITDSNKAMTVYGVQETTDTFEPDANGKASAWHGTVTFPVAFAKPPTVLISVEEMGTVTNDAPPLPAISAVSTSGFDFKAVVVGVAQGLCLHWQALGQTI